MYSQTLPYISLKIEGLPKLKKILSIIQLWQQRSKSRKQLAKLPAYRLQDMGITQDDQEKEVKQPFWK